MKIEFTTLSESKFKVKEYHNGMIMYPEKKVKEFIKRLKEELTNDEFLKQEGDEDYEEYTQRVINNLAGEELSK